MAKLNNYQPTQVSAGLERASDRTLRNTCQLADAGSEQWEVATALACDHSLSAKNHQTPRLTLVMAVKQDAQAAPGNMAAHSQTLHQVWLGARWPEADKHWPEPELRSMFSKALSCCMFGQAVVCLIDSLECISSSL